MSFRCVILVLVLAICTLLCAARKPLVNDHCPCESGEPKGPSGGGRPIESRGHNLCVLFDDKCLSDEKDRILVSEAREILSNSNETIPIDIFLVDDPLVHGQSSHSKRVDDMCNVVMRVLPSSDFEVLRGERSLCPGKCFKTPEFQVPITWLLAQTVTPQLLRHSSRAVVGGAVVRDKGKERNSISGGIREDVGMTCSLGLQQYLHEAHVSAHGTSAALQANAPAIASSLNHLLIVLFWRRLMECREEQHWASSYRTFKATLAEYTASEQQYNNHGLHRPAKRRLEQEGMTLGQWENALRAENKRLGNSKHSRGIGVTGSPKNSRKQHGKGRVNVLPHTKGDADVTQVIAGRRKVEALVIWIGQESTMSLMQEQARMLEGQDNAGTRAVVGWAADDNLYGCAEGTIKCERTTQRRFRPYLPETAINFMPEGWGCAQRRPLRALAHTLLLYDPTFILLADDDTFVNYPLLISKYGKYILSDMSRHPIAVGEFVGSYDHVTKKGLFVGGAGYIIGRNLLNRLIQKELWALGGLGLPGGLSAAELRSKHNFTGDPYRSVQQMEKLSLLVDAVEQSENKCGRDQNSAESAQSGKKFEFGSEATNDFCLPSLIPVPSKRSVSSTKLRSTETIPGGDQTLRYQDWTFPASSILAQEELNQRIFKEGSRGHYEFESMVVPIQTRLIDLCMNLMSNEGTCQHSDHAMGRCLFYGTAGVPVGSPCYSEVPIETVPGVNKLTGEQLIMGMCFMGKECDVTSMLTCHRFKPGATSDFHRDHQGKGSKVEMMTKSGAALSKYLGGNPTKIKSENSYYKNYSSFWNGTHADTNDIYS